MKVKKTARANIHKPKPMNQNVHAIVALDAKTHDASPNELKMTPPTSKALIAASARSKRCWVSVSQCPTFSASSPSPTAV
jgi:hypothetical protein